MAAGWFSGVGALALYAFTAPRTVGSGDAAEFQVLSATGGIAHAGYPALVLLLRLFHLLPIGSAALRANLLSCVAGAVAVGLVACVATRWSGRAWAGIASALALALSRVMWSESTIAGVHAFTLALDASLFVLLGLALGFAPLTYLVLADRPGRPMNYLEDTLDLSSGQYLPAGTPPMSHLQRVEWLLSAKQYLVNSPYRPFQESPRRLFYLACDLIMNSLLPLGLLGGLAGIWIACRQRRREGWLLAAWMAGVLTLLLYGASFEMTPIFFLPGLWALALGLGLALNAASDRARWVPAVALVLLALAPIVRLLAPAPAFARGIAGRALLLWPAGEGPFAREQDWASYGREVMANLPPRSMVLVCWKEAGALRYFQYAEPLRGDVEFLYTCRNAVRVGHARERGRAEGRPVFATYEPAPSAAPGAARVQSVRPPGLWSLRPLPDVAPGIRR